MKVAIVQEWLVSVGGSDKVTRDLLDLFPGSDLFTIVYEDKTLKELGIRVNRIHTTFLQKSNFLRKHFRSFLPLFPYLVEQFDLSDYDIIISSSHTVAKGVITGPNQLHICYCHSPVRYAWDKYHEYLRDHGLKSGFKNLIVRYTLHRLRLWDVVSSNRVDYFIANSHFVSRRIKKYYNRDSKVIYPPIEVDKFSLNEDKHDYFVTASRLVPYKRINIIIEAFNKMPEKRLLVIGDGPEMKRLKSIANDNVELLGYIREEELITKIGSAKAFVFAAEEDFGMLPVEAQACGTPVIAFNRGGARESVVDGLTGIFFEEQTSESIINAVERFDKMSFDYKIIRKQSEKFSTDSFKESIREYVLTKYKDFQSGF